MAKRDRPEAVVGLRLTALSVEAVAEMLSKLGASTATPEMIRADLESGAPVNADGTIDFIEYAAWLVRRMTRGS